MKNFNFIFLRLSFYLLAGILIAFYLKLSSSFVIIGSSLSILFFLIAYFRARQQVFTDIIPGIATFLVIFFTGISITHFSIPKNQSAHYLQHISDFNSNKTLLLATVSEELKPGTYYDRYILKAQHLISESGKQTKVTGKILLNLKRDSLSPNKLSPGNKIAVPFSPKEINEPVNPFQFNYRDYMKSLNVEKQLTISPAEYKLTNATDDNLIYSSWKLREFLIEKLRKNNFSKDQLAVFQALILGQRRDISDELYKNYAAAGAIHILAISGLHIGIILLLLNFLFKPLERLPHGKLLKLVSIIILLWSFAVITGLSPSVIRAVTMFSFIAIGMQLNRKTSVLNSIFLSLFFLLLINPFFIFQVGFQLSYLAVLSIVLFQPFIYDLITPKLRVIKYLWQLISVSLAAQIAILPASLYYFHQFPGLFLITNLVILPFLGILLIGGILIIFLAVLNLLPVFLKDFFGGLLDFMNLFIEKVAGYSSLVFTNIDFSLLQTFSAYLILISILMLLLKRNFARIALFLSAILIFQVAIFINILKVPENEAVVFHKSKQSIIAMKRNDSVIIYSTEKDNFNFFKDYERKRLTASKSFKEFPKLIDLSGKLTLIIRSEGNYQLNNFQPDIVLLQNSPKINLERIIENLQPKQIIADGSNYNSYIKKWNKTSENKKIPFHYTGEKGAYIID